MEEMTLETIELRPEIKMKKAMRAIFLILCTFPVLAILASLPTLAYSMFSSLFNTELSYSLDVYYIFSFALPQIIYPLLTLIAAFIMLSITGKSKREAFRIKDAPFLDIILALFAFLGMGTVGSYISDFITQIIINLGVPVPDMSEFIITPESPLQFCLFLVSVAILPAICEEFVFRGAVCGILKEWNKTAAIIISSLAFSLMHATIQQIPFAFVMGLFLGYLYIRFDSLLPGILLHFANNFISCIFTVLYEDIAEETYTLIYTIYDIATVVLGIAALVFFIIRRIKERKETTEKEKPTVTGSKLINATVLSWAMWLFIVIYLFETVANIVLLSY